MTTLKEEQQNELLSNLSLGHKSQYETQYNPKLLQSVPRSLNRDTLELRIPFAGYDLWHMYELSWLNNKGKPMVAVGEIRVPSESPYIVESKSLKLYLNSFNQTKFSNIEDVRQTISTDLSKLLLAEVQVQVWSLNSQEAIEHFSLKQISSEAVCLDEIDTEINQYSIDPTLLKTRVPNQIVSETLCSNLLKSNCLVTGQPDWGTVYIKYTGPAIDHKSLLKYIVSMRGHNEFHEHCVERIFTDIANTFSPQDLEVRAFYTRRGGLDINPVRSMSSVTQSDIRLIRQ